MTRVLREEIRVLLPGPCLMAVGDPEPEPEYGVVGPVAVPDDWEFPKSVEDALEFETDD